MRATRLTAVLVLAALLGTPPASGSGIHGHGTHFDFDYDAFNHWGTVSATCAKGKHQSPIDMQTAAAPSDSRQPDVHLHPAMVKYSRTRHNFQYSAPVGDKWCSTVTYRGEKFHMQRAHFHSPSEHHFDGEAYELEVHFVHKAETSNHLLVLGVVFGVGADSAPVQTLLDIAQGKHARVVDFPAFVQPGSALCTYEGSLTTPPCTEGVHWLIAKSPLTVSREQVKLYRRMVDEHDNNRPIQAESQKAHPEARCYANPNFSGAIPSIANRRA